MSESETPNTTYGEGSDSSLNQGNQEQPTGLNGGSLSEGGGKRNVKNTGRKGENWSTPFTFKRDIEEAGAVICTGRKRPVDKDNFKKLQ